MDHRDESEHRGYEVAREVAATHQSVFDPAALQVLQEAFEGAWADLLAVHAGLADEQSARDMIARRIVNAASGSGERDLELLKRHALKGFRS